MSTSKIRVATAVAFEILFVFPEPAVGFAVTASFVAPTTANHRAFHSSQVSFLLWKQLRLMAGNLLSRPSRSTGGCFQTLPQPQLGERDTFYLTAKLLITVTFPVFADVTNFCLR